MTEPTYTDTRTETVRLENSFGVVAGSESTLEMTANVWLWESNAKRGSWEWYGTSDEGREYYESGGLWFNEEGFLTDFDGSFDLPPVVVRWLHGEGRLTNWYVDLWTKEGVLE